MIKRSIARRYSRALYDLVQTDPLPTATQLSEFESILSSSPMLLEVLVSPAFLAQERQKVLEKVLERLQIKAPLSQFIKLLTQRRRINYLSAINQSFTEMVDEREGQVRVQVESAGAMDVATLGQLQKTLAAALGKKVLMQQQVNGKLLAGLSLKVGGLLVDGSLSTQLTKLRDGLKAKRA